MNTTWTPQSTPFNLWSTALRAICIWAFDGVFLLITIEWCDSAVPLLITNWGRKRAVKWSHRWVKRQGMESPVAGRHDKQSLLLPGEGTSDGTSWFTHVQYSSETNQPGFLPLLQWDPRYWAGHPCTELQLREDERQQATEWKLQLAKEEYAQESSWIASGKDWAE